MATRTDSYLAFGKRTLPRNSCGWRRNLEAEPRPSVDVGSVERERHVAEQEAKTVVVAKIRRNGTASRTDQEGTLNGFLLALEGLALMFGEHLDFALPAQFVIR
jgi:hypothetical protein